MARRPRERSEADIYHAISRGVGRQRIFEDDVDRAEFMAALAASAARTETDIWAWCLMENHVHLLARAPLDRLSEAMRVLQTRYALFFNAAHGHAGHLFQGRFKSIAVNSDSQLVATVCYIHRNPVAAGIVRSCADYRWSSYNEYLNLPEKDSRKFVVEAFGSLDEFVRIHSSGGDDVPDSSSAGCRMGDAEAMSLLVDVCGPGGAEALVSMGKRERDNALRLLKASGLTVRQIERLTGIGRSIIQRA